MRDSNKHILVGSSLSDILYLIFSGDESKKDFVPKKKLVEDSTFTAIDQRTGRPKDPATLTSFDKIEVLQQTVTKNTEQAGGFRVKKISPKEINIQFNIESYLHQDKINEIINIESLERTLDDVLTISDDEMNRLMGCSGDAINLLGEKRNMSLCPCVLI